MSGEITIVGWGNQAKAWGANLRDSGLKVHVLLRAGSASKGLAEKVATVHDINGVIPPHPIALLIPDHEIPQAVAALAERFPPGGVFLYAHGYALDEAQLAEKFPHHHHVLLAPKAIGMEVRATYVDKRPLGGVYSVEKVPATHQAAIEKLTLDLARALGITMGPYACTVRQEMVADLFSEQAVLCSVIPEACRVAFEMLRARGTPPELAFFELWHEVGLIVKVMVDKGPEAFFNLISPNALIGAEKGRQVLCDDHFRAGMEKLLKEIENGTFQKTVATTDPNTVRAETLARWQNSELGRTVTRMHQGHS